MPFQALEDLGSGFTSAMHDLEIRGAGEVLGEHQSGEIAEVGYDLYNRMFMQAVKAFKARRNTAGGRSAAALDGYQSSRPGALLPRPTCRTFQRLAFYKAFASAEDRAAPF